MTSPRNTPRMVTHQCSDIRAPFNRDSQVRKNIKPPGKCGLNGPLQMETEACQKTLQPIAVHTLQVYNDVESDKAQSRVFMVKVIIKDLLNRIVNNILRSSSVF
jgi:hypothetical protein